MIGLTSLSLLAVSIMGVSAISDAQYNKLVEVSNFANIAYCMRDSNFVSNEALSSEPCTLDFCDSYPDVEVVATIRPDLSRLQFSGTAFVAADNSSKTVYVALRGSQSLADWITDYEVTLCPYAPYLSSSGLNSTTLAAIDQTEDAISQLIMDLGDTDACKGNCLVHCGIYVAFSQFMDEIYSAALPYLDQGYDLVVTGHSLGGAYAALTGVDFKFKGYNPLLITYASFKQGNEEYNAFADGLFGTASKDANIAAGDAFKQGTYVRVYSNYDIVPHLPPGSVIYTNSGLQFELTTSDLPQTKDEVIYKGPSNNAWDDAPLLNIFDVHTYDVHTNHVSYFSKMNTCNK